MSRRCRSAGAHLGDRPRARDRKTRLPPAALKDWTVRLAPMVGCFGVAPAKARRFRPPPAAPTAATWTIARFTPGTTSICRFSRRARCLSRRRSRSQGDGEIVGTGIETSFDIEFTVRLIKGRTIGWPRGETKDEIFTVGNARPLDRRFKTPPRKCSPGWANYGLDAISASTSCSARRCATTSPISSDPAYSVACRIARSALAGIGERG